jgi:phage-related protein
MLYSDQVQIRSYRSSSGRLPMEEFILALPHRLQAAVVETMARLRQQGLGAPGVSLRQVRGKLWEIRVSAGGAVRIFYCTLAGGTDETLILLHAYQKKTPKAPPREIEVAEKRMREVLP